MIPFLTTKDVLKAPYIHIGASALNTHFHLLLLSFSLSHTYRGEKKLEYR